MRVVGVCVCVCVCTLLISSHVSCWSITSIFSMADTWFVGSHSSFLHTLWSTSRFTFGSLEMC